MKKVISLILTFTLLILLINPIQNPNRAVAATYSGVVNHSCNFRSGPSTEHSKIDIGGTTMLPVNLAVTIEDKAYDSAGDMWYKISFSYKDKAYSGYAFAEYITKDVNSATADAEFEAYMTEQGFPESYKPYLRTLHAEHPNWKFVAQHTNIEWNTVLANEYSRANSKKNTVWTASYSPNYNWRATQVNYDILNNKWSPHDGNEWFLAADDLVAYYLDPRIYLDELHVFAFESLSYIEGVHTEEGVKTILDGSFMGGDSIAYKDTRTYSSLIMAAAKTYKISPYHIASRIRLEMGNTPTAAADGTYNGHYNYYNIGAYDGENALKAGLDYAAKEGSYGRPWNTVEKSINGGAEFLVGSYIGVGQDTLYTQKFNVTNGNSLFGHQYCTNVEMPYTESVTSSKAYVKIGAIDSALVFKIPVYLNMPEKVMTKPSANGNPNNYLKELSVAGYTVSPAFSVGETTAYSLTVGGNVESVTINAIPAHANAMVVGQGTIGINPGTNVIYIDVTSQSGRLRRYRLTVVRGEASSEENIIVPDPSSRKGDMNGDGKISAVDIVKIQRIIVGLDALTDANKALADINGDGKVSALDIVKLQRHIVGLEHIVW